MPDDAGGAGRPRIRPREPADLPALVEALLRQQPETGYPFRNPLPFPVEEFLHEADAVRAWTAEVDGRPVGHVCRTAPGGDGAAAVELDTAAARGHGCRLEELAWVSALFVASEARGHGTGRRLLHTVVEDIRSDGRRPSLEVLSHNTGAFSLYLASGWRRVHRFRPAWLVAAAGETGPDVHVLVLDGAGHPT